MRRISAVCLMASVMLLKVECFPQKSQDLNFECRIFEKTIKCKKYIEQYYYEAIKQMLIYGIPASITLAQGLLESSMGESELALFANNHFGIKCQNSWLGPIYTYDDDKENECFRKYNSAFESYSDHSKFLRFRPRYAFLFELKPTDYFTWAKGLKLAGYATDPQYAEKLIGIIRENTLNLYDSIGYLLSLSSATNKYQTTDTTNNSIQTDIYSLLNGVNQEDEAVIRKENNRFVEVAGKVCDRKNGKGRSAKIYVYKQNTLCGTYKTNSKGKCKIKLPLNNQFTLVFAEEGYLSKKIYFDTRVPYLNDTLYKFKYTVYLFEEIKNMKVSLFNEPVALVALNDYNQFDYDDWHSIIINKRVEEMYDNYYLLADK